VSFENLSLFFSIARCFGLLNHHQAIYTVITKTIELHNGSVVSRSDLSSLAMHYYLFSDSLIN
jgi:hypothetical protein